MEIPALLLSRTYLEVPRCGSWMSGLELTRPSLQGAGMS
jgi:hypothetical protein